MVIQLLKNELLAWLRSRSSHSMVNWWPF